jgi:hypothetical protein
VSAPLYDTPVPGAASGVYSADQAQRIATLDPEPDNLSRLPLDPQSPNNTSSIALGSQLIVVSGPAKLFGFSVYSNRASSQFIQVFDIQGTAGAGAVPVMVFTVAATANLGVYWGTAGRWFDRGITIANSSTAATLTAGSADTWFDVQWI